MSVSQIVLGVGAVNRRSTKSSWTGGPALRLRPRFLAKIDQIRCWEHSRVTRFSPAAMPRWRSSSAMNR
jgi:hypothetical protein